MKTPATALAVATDLPGTTKGALFCEGTKNDGTANGFKNDKKFVEIYHASLADGKVDNKAGNLTVKDAAIEVVKYNFVHPVHLFCPYAYYIARLIKFCL